MRLYLDEDVPVAIAASLRRHKADVLTACEAGTAQTSDREQLTFASAQGRALVSRNVRHFMDLALTAVQEQRPHAGIILISARFRGNETKAIAEGLLRILRAHPDGIEPYGVRFL